MLIAFLKTGIAAVVITFASWLAGKKPELAGFIIALPLASLLALAFSYAQHQNSAASITFAKSILVGVPVSWLFFLPFFFAEKAGLHFIGCYVLGSGLLVAGFFAHQYLIKFF